MRNEEDYVSVFLMCWVYPTPFIEEGVVRLVCIFGASVEKYLAVNLWMYF